MHRLNRILLLYASAAVAQASTNTVVPNSLTSIEGNAINDWPFAISLRYEQVYAASQSANGGLITQIALRPDATFGGAFSDMILNIHIDLSTTSATPDALSSTLDNDVGADDQVVYMGSLGISTSFTGLSGGSKAFDIIINHQSDHSVFLQSQPGKLTARREKLLWNISPDLHIGTLHRRHWRRVNSWRFGISCLVAN